MEIHEADLAPGGADEAEILAGLADDIWTEYYTPLIGAEQVAYMLVTIQSAEWIAQDIGQRGYRYWLAEDQGKPVAYCGAVVQMDRLFLSKLYVTHDYRGQGIGKQFVGIVEQWCREVGLPRIQLTVNKGNTDSIKAYEHLGFTIVDAIVTDIGGGFVMDDYVMDKPIGVSRPGDEVPA